MVEFHDTPYPMTLTWQPNQGLFEQLARHVGLLDSSLEHDLVADFTSYWCGQAHRYHTTFQWHQKLVQNIKHKRTAFRRPDTKVVGTQHVPKTVALDYDDNAAQLLARYGKQ